MVPTLLAAFSTHCRVFTRSTLR